MRCSIIIQPHNCQSRREFCAPSVDAIRPITSKDKPDRLMRHARFSTPALTVSLSGMRIDDIYWIV